MWLWLMSNNLQDTYADKAELRSTKSLWHTIPHACNKITVFSKEMQRGNIDRNSCTVYVTHNATEMKSNEKFIGDLQYHLK